ncbi:gag-pol [Trichonephila clavipes]|nr:gag-pol [Trichonephila clavipes]
MEWPACSPDLNPIEHVWDILGRRIAARPRSPATVRDLEIALLEEWNSIPQSLIDNLIASMANRRRSITCWGYRKRHGKGSADGNVNAPLRRPCPENIKYSSRVKNNFGMTDPVVRKVTTPSTSEADPRSDERVRKDQLADPEIKPIIECKDSFDGKPSWQDIAPSHPTTERY